MSPSPSVAEATPNEQRNRIRRARKPFNCEPCRRSKLRCDRCLPCTSCSRRGLVSLCTYRNLPQGHDSGPTNDDTLRQSPAIDNGFGRKSSHLPAPLPEHDGRSLLHPSENLAASDSHARWEEIFQRPTDQPWYTRDGQGCQPNGFNFPFSLGPDISKQDLLSLLPPKECCDYLIIQYFSRLSPLYHILHGPTFQREYTRFFHSQAETSLSWMALLFVLCSVTLNTMEDSDPSPIDSWRKETETLDFRATAAKFRNRAMVCLSQDRFLIRHSLHTLQALLILIYGMSHNAIDVCEGMALNIGIALRCNIKTKPSTMGCIEFEQRRRCWAGIIMLHTYQAILFRDVNVSAFSEIEVTLPADPTQMSVVVFKLRLFEISSRVCDLLSRDTELTEDNLTSFHSLISQEQAKWDAKFLIDGQPSVLGLSSYAHWCILQQYAHQLYLLLHRAFCRSRLGQPPRFESQLKCTTSGVALLEIHRQFAEFPRLRRYRWYVYGTTSFCAFHGAVAMASCLLMAPGSLNASAYKSVIDAAVVRFEALRERSTICAKAYPIISHLRTMIWPDNSDGSPMCPDSSDVLDEWFDSVPWLNVDSVNWASNSIRL
ncbi:uncharacterized protein BDW70DRAFT_152239 [Aspergillus foveolatus]|uniref:uncharacterized protein n=1 Tax=Aspergillus foveolatus TaxID=210207 RepID=UPI003CCCD3C3